MEGSQPLHLCYCRIQNPDQLLMNLADRDLLASFKLHQIIIHQIAGILRTA
ncbi:hypothetical protein D3C75_1216650 [compost metagenome]